MNQMILFEFTEYLTAKFKKKNKFYPSDLCSLNAYCIVVSMKSPENKKKKQTQSQI